MRILLTAIGRRVQLIEHLKKNNYIVGIDCNDLSPSKDFVNKYYQVPSCEDDNYINKLINICEKERIDMIIPLYEPEFLMLDKFKNRFKNIGTELLLNNKRILDICGNKEKTYNFFMKNNIKAPKVFNDEEITIDINYPLIIKPKVGMGSKSVYKVENREELKFFLKYTKNSIIQEFIDGVEYTVDVLYDLQGNLISVVPRERLEVRSGEVSKSKSVKNREIIQATIEVCDKLKTLSQSLIGPLNIQCIVDKNGDIKFIEINPRLSGGVPLTIQSGVNYSKCFDMMIKGENIEPIVGEFKELTMLRFDDAIYF